MLIEQRDRLEIQAELVEKVREQFSFSWMEVGLNYIACTPPMNEAEYGEREKFWNFVFTELYKEAKVVQRLAGVTFWHQLPNQPAQPQDYTETEQKWRAWPRLAKLLGKAVPDKKIEGAMLAIEARHVSLLFVRREREEGYVSFYLTSPERKRIEQPGLQGMTVMLPITHPHQIFVLTGSITRIVFAE